MDKQHSDHIENRFRQAAENFLPSQNEEAWKKMEAMLDNDHDKRRVFIWWWWPLTFLSFLVISAGLYYHYNDGPEDAAGAKVDNRPSTNNRLQRAEKHEQPATGLSIQPAEQSKTGMPSKKASGSDQLAEPTKQPSLVGVNSGIRKTSRPGPSYQHTNRFVAMRNRRSASNPQAVDVRKKTDKDAKVTDNTEAPLLASAYKLPSLQQTDYSVGIDIPEPVLNASHKLLIHDSLLHTASTISKEQPKPAKLYLVVSAGENATSLRKFDTKNTATVYGAEIGYHINSSFSIQAGFHAGRKIYYAYAGDYTVKPGTYLSTVRIMKIDANCLIYDIPLSLRFDIMRNRNNALYAIAGVSSFIMKTENYKYHYSTSTGGYRQQAVKYKGNVDLFSSANLAVGFEQKVLKTLHVQVAPYAKLPISGIGEGKIKLYSLGIQIGLKYQPLKKQRR